MELHITKDFSVKVTGRHNLSFNESYDDFDSFMDDNRESIYRTILRSFIELKEYDSVTINIHGFIADGEVKSVLNYTKENSNILIDVINPYFENIEEYETCTVVMKIYNELVS